MENLHSDILENVLSRIPIEEALHAKRVSKTWRAILRYKTSKKVGFFFTFSHGAIGIGKVREYLFYEDEYDHYDHTKMNCYTQKTLSKIEHGRFITKYPVRGIMVGSCNGLVCFRKFNEDDSDAKCLADAEPFLICNPLTGESVFLPKYNYHELPYGGRLASGFGYCPSTKKYKVVTTCYSDAHKTTHVQVYTVGCGWRYSGCIDGYIYNDSPGIYADGALYWLQENLDNVQESQIVAFDMEDEKFDYIKLPRSREFEHKTSNTVKLLGGNDNLYLSHHNTDIWVYKKNNVNHSSSPWTKEFSMQMKSPRPTPFAITRNNEVLLWYSLYKNLKIEMRLYCYDPKTSTLNCLWDNQAMGMKNLLHIEAIPHCRSIVSLKDLGETNVTSLKDLEKLMLQVYQNGSKRSKIC